MELLIPLPGLRPMRERLLLTQVDVGERARLAPETICRIEAGRPVRMQTARQLATGLGVAVDELRGESARTPG